MYNNTESLLPNTTQSRDIEFTLSVGHILQTDILHPACSFRTNYQVLDYLLSLILV